MYIVYKVVWKKYSQNKIIIYNCEEKYDQLGNKLLNKNCVEKDLTGKHILSLKSFVIEHKCINSSIINIYKAFKIIPIFR